MRHLVIAAALAIGLTACTAPADDSSAEPTNQPSASAEASASASPASGFAVTSPDFAEGDELADWATANAFGGQCTGENLNPALEWSGAPEATESYVIVMLDRSADNFFHWVHFDIPGDVTGVARGASGELAGHGSTNGVSGTGYFGPCPPGPDHRYEFTVYALDSLLELGENASFVDIKAGIDAHLLAQASIVGMRSGTTS